MKTEKLKFFLFFILLIIVFGSCNHDEKIADNLYRKRNYLLKEFKDKSIINIGRNVYQLSFYKKDLVNTFFFTKEDDRLKLSNDSLEFYVNEIPAFVSIKVEDSAIYRSSLTDELTRLLKIMAELKIYNVTSEFAPVGVNLKIYFGGYKALLYVADMTAVKNERWLNYIKSGKKLDENWYYVKDKLGN